MVFLLALAAGVACAPHTSARVEGAPRRAIAPVDSVLALYFEAVGGIEAIRAISSRRMEGTYVEGDLHATTDIAWQRPLLRRVNVHAPGFDYAEGFDGVTWEFNFKSAKLVVDTGIAAATGRRGAEFDEPFVDYAQHGNKAALLGNTVIDGRELTHIAVTFADGWEKDYYFDPTSHLVVAMRKAMPIHATGSPVETLTHYEDWRRESGVLQAHRFVERIVETGRTLNTLQWERIRSNVAIPLGELRPPVRGRRQLDQE